MLHSHNAGVVEDGTTGIALFLDAVQNFYAQLRLMFTCHPIC